VVAIPPKKDDTAFDADGKAIRGPASVLLAFFVAVVVGDSAIRCVPNWCAASASEVEADTIALRENAGVVGDICSPRMASAHS
jgi:hypothetical protein